MKMKFFTAVRSLTVVLAICLTGENAKAQDVIIISTQSAPEVTSTLLTTRPPQPTDTIPKKPKMVTRNRFTWGTDLGSSFDLTNQDLTSFDLSACFGLRNNRAIRFLGIGAAIHMVTNNSSRCYPVYLQFRTTFTSEQQFVFLDVKAGISFVNLYNSVNRKPLYASAGIGFTLASGRNFSSHIILGYSFTPLKGIEIPQQPHPLKDLHQAVLRLGVAF